MSDKTKKELKFLKQKVGLEVDMAKPKSNLLSFLIFFFFFLYIFYSYVHTVFGSFLPP
jgi:hypothetical protein